MRSICILGDSITEGAGASGVKNAYVSLLNGMLKEDYVYNFGISATRIANQKVPNGWELADKLSMVDRIKAIPYGREEILVIFGGTNDFGHGDALFGDDSSTDTYTFLGALKTLFDVAKERFTSKNVVVVLPLPRFDEDSTRGACYSRKPEGSPTFKEYKDAIKKYTKLYGFNLLDLDNLFYRPEKDNYSELFFDGLHPNDAGHRLIAEQLYKKLKELYNIK